MSSLKPIFINQKGMVTIPIKLRKKYGLKEGTEVTFVEIEGAITTIPIEDLKKKSNISLKDLMQSIDEEHEIDIRIED
jgi:AbrB family looped-hinge helix DNA binding protein